jgi:hypothetical protein
MSHESLPTIYILEVYENSFLNGPSYIIKSQTPFSAINVGNYFSHLIHTGWDDKPDDNKEKFIVSEIDHSIYSVKNVENKHKTMIIVKKVSYNWNK